VEKRSCSNKFIETRNDGDRCVHTKLALALYSLLWTERTTRGKLHIDRFGLYFTTAWQRSINAIIEYAAFLIWLSVLRAELPYDGGCSNIPKPKSFRGASVAVIPPSVERADLIVHQISPSTILAAVILLVHVLLVVVIEKHCGGIYQTTQRQNHCTHL
jgi:hypothetical protein